MTHQTLLQEALQKAEQAIARMEAMRNQHEQAQQNQIAMITQEIQKQSGAQVQQALQNLDQQAAVAKQELDGLRSWMGGNGVSLQQWTEATSKDFADFKQEMGRVVNDIRTAGGPGQAGGWTTRGRGILESKVWSGV